MLELLSLTPVIASFRAKSLKGMIIGSAIWGGFFAIGGFFLSIAIDIPASSSIAALASVAFIIIYFFRHK